VIAPGTFRTKLEEHADLIAFERIAVYTTTQFACILKAIFVTPEWFQQSIDWSSFQSCPPTYA